MVLKDRLVQKKTMNFIWQEGRFQYLRQGCRNQRRFRQISSCISGRNKKGIRQGSGNDYARDQAGIRPEISQGNWDQAEIRMGSGQRVVMKTGIRQRSARDQILIGKRGSDRDQQGIRQRSGRDQARDQLGKLGSGRDQQGIRPEISWEN